MQISDAFTRYAADAIVFKNQSRKTEENHYICMRALIAFFEDIDITELTFPQIRDWKEALSRSRSPETVRNYVIKLRVVLDYLKKQGVCCLDPDSIPVPKRRDKVPVFLSATEVARCVSATQRIKNKAIISLLYASGIRISELCALDSGQLSQGRFTVVGKGGRARLCFYDERTDCLLHQYLQTRADNNLALFLSDSGRRITPGAIQETFKSVRKQTGLMVHPHSLRHSFATNLLETNTNLFHVSKLLGHAQLSTTQQYLHCVDFDLQAVYNSHHTV